MINVALLSVIRRWRHRDGRSIRDIARSTGLSRNTVKKYLASNKVEPQHSKCKKPSKLDEYSETLTSWLHLKLSDQRSEHLRKEKLIRRARIDALKDEPQTFETRFDQALDELYQDPTTTIENIQTRLALSYSALMGHCKKTYAKSPKRLLIEKRIEVASQLLLESDYKIGFISELAGFSSHSQFAIVFKKETGMTAAAFRQKKSST